MILCSSVENSSRLTGGQRTSSEIDYVTELESPGSSGGSTLSASTYSESFNVRDRFQSPTAKKHTRGHLQYTLRDILLMTSAPHLYYQVRGILGLVLIHSLAVMYAVVAQLIILSAIGRAFPRTNAREDVIWFPIDGYENGYVSSQGEYFASKPSNNWYGGSTDNTVGLPDYRRRFRSVPATPQDNYLGTNTGAKEIAAGPEGSWDRPGIKRTISADDSLIFPDEISAGRTRQDDCKANCPLTPEYNPVCGTDSRNYHNFGTLECERVCGRRVRFAHFGICGRTLPGVFKPTPRLPRSTTERATANLASDDRTDRRFKFLRI